jgi:hypothetical protein
LEGCTWALEGERSAKEKEKIDFVYDEFHNGNLIKRLDNLSLQLIPGKSKDKVYLHPSTVKHIKKMFQFFDQLPSILTESDSDEILLIIIYNFIDLLKDNYKFLFDHFKPQDATHVTF